MIIFTQKDKDNKELLTIENINKIIVVEVIKMSSVIDLEHKYS